MFKTFIEYLKCTYLIFKINSKIRAIKSYKKIIDFKLSIYPDEKIYIDEANTLQSMIDKHYESIKKIKEFRL